MQRLDKFLCEAGVAGRRQLREQIKNGHVYVNGARITDPGGKVDPRTDEICMDGKRISAQRRIVLALHKPAGYVTSTNDPRERTVMELLPPQYLQLFPVGRLDKDTEGLLLFTNDGALAHRLISPRYEMEKVYYAEHEGTADVQDIEAFRRGCMLRDGTRCLPAALEPCGQGKSIVRIREGKYHQVRRMLASRGKHVTYLRRIAHGEIALGTLLPGQVRELTEQELSSLDAVHFDE